MNINEIELAATLASIELENGWRDSIQIWDDETAAIQSYTDEAQDIFNELYDKYLAMIKATEDKP